MARRKAAKDWLPNGLASRFNDAHELWAFAARQPTDSALAKDANATKVLINALRTKSMRTVWGSLREHGGLTESGADELVGRLISARLRFRPKPPKALAAPKRKQLQDMHRYLRAAQQLMARRELSEFFGNEVRMPLNRYLNWKEPESGVTRASAISRHSLGKWSDGNQLVDYRPSTAKNRISYDWPTYGGALRELSAHIESQLAKIPMLRGSRGKRELAFRMGKVAFDSLWSSLGGKLYFVEAAAIANAISEMEGAQRITNDDLRKHCGKNRPEIGEPEAPPECGDEFESYPDY